ncbi:MAG TPA: GAF domain-containing protein, partial [Gemmata sp.]|nr:GAF domain-containing protein [Gemmata sp.]
MSRQERPHDDGGSEQAGGISCLTPARQQKPLPSMGLPHPCRETSGCDQYQTLLAVSQAIVAHRDLAGLFHDLAGRLHQVVRFDHLALVLHEATTNTMRMHVLETCEPPPYPVIVLPVDEDPAGMVWQSQQPLVTSSVAELNRWPRLLEIVQRYGVQSYCWLPLTTARRRLGALVFTSNEPSAYDEADLGFLQQAANQ